MAEWSETTTGYNADEMFHLYHEVLGPVERERLDRTPWARAVAADLIQRIYNLRRRIRLLEEQAHETTGIHNEYGSRFRHAED